MIKAKDIMRKDVIVVSEDMTVRELGRLFMEKGISGAPVVDKDGTLKGIVTENDLISQNKRLHIPTFLRLFDAIIPLENLGTLEEEIKKMTASTVAEICTRDVISVGEDTEIEEIATLMVEKRIHLLPVVRDGKLVGIIGRHEVLRGISS